MLPAILAIILSIGAINALVPIMIIIILIAAAAGATRGFSIFQIFGIASVLQGTGSIGGGSRGSAAKAGYPLRVYLESQPMRVAAKGKFFPARKAINVATPLAKNPQTGKRFSGITLVSESKDLEKLGFPKDTKLGEMQGFSQGVASKGKEESQKRKEEALSFLNSAKPEDLQAAQITKKPPRFVRLAATGSRKLRKGLLNTAGILTAGSVAKGMAQSVSSDIKSINPKAENLTRTPRLTKEHGEVRNEQDLLRKKRLEQLKHRKAVGAAIAKQVAAARKEYGNITLAEAARINPEISKQITAGRGLGNYGKDLAAAAKGLELRQKALTSEIERLQGLAKSGVSERTFVKEYSRSINRLGWGPVDNNLLHNAVNPQYGNTPSSVVGHMANRIGNAAQVAKFVGTASAATVTLGKFEGLNNKAAEYNRKMTEMAVQQPGGANFSVKLREADLKRTQADKSKSAEQTDGKGKEQNEMKRQSEQMEREKRRVEEENKKEEQRKKEREKEQEPGNE